MDKTLSFFRVFDLALFLPGAVIYWLCHSHSWLSDFDPFKPALVISGGEGLLALIMTIGLVYGLGLGVHAAQRLLRPLWRRAWRQERPSSWYQKLQAGPGADLAIYFWYMRATCWNLALSLILVAVILFVVNKPLTPLLLLLAFAGLLAYLGCDFDQALRRITGCS